MFLTRKRESLQKLVGDYSGVDTALFRLDTLPEQFLKNPTLIRTIELFAAAGYPRPDDLVELKELANRRWMVKDRKNKRIFEIRVFQDAVIVHAHLARDVNANMSIQLLRPRGRSVTIYSERENNWKPDQIRRIDLADRIVSENGGKIAEISSETRIESGDAVNVTITINNSDEGNR